MLMLRTRIQHYQVRDVPLFRLVADETLLIGSQCVVIGTVLLPSTIICPNCAELFYTDGLGYLLSPTLSAYALVPTDDPLDCLDANS